MEENKNEVGIGQRDVNEVPVETVNIFRPVYRDLTDIEKNTVDEIKEKANELYHLFPQTGGRGKNREVAIAMTKLEESVMWAVKGITL